MGAINALPSIAPKRKPADVLPKELRERRIKVL